MDITIPGYGRLRLQHLVMDYNGTLAVDGRLVDGVRKALIALSEELSLHVITADTFGKAAAELDGIPCKLGLLPADDQHIRKKDYVAALGKEQTVSIGNGRNDQLMLKISALGIAVILAEGIAAETLLASDVVCTSIIDALDLLRNPLRLTATLRS
jgi:soluble P-type ATPase